MEFKKESLIYNRLTEEDGSVFVITDPAGATVYLDDAKLGSTRPNTGLKVNDIASGSHKLRVEKAGYAIEEEEIDIHAFKVTSRPLNLRRVATGRLEIVSEDIGAHVEVKGQDQSDEIPVLGRLVMDDLVEGRYTLLISKAGYAGKKIRAKVIAGETTTLRVRLKGTEYWQKVGKRLASATRSLVLPGWGQYENGDTKKGYTFGALWLAGGLIVWGFEADAKQNRDAAATLANSKGQEIDLSAGAPAALQKAKDDDQAALITAGITGLIWAYAVGDAFVVENRSGQSASGWYLTPNIQQARLDTGYRWRF